MFEIGLQLIVFAAVLAVVAVLVRAALAPRFQFMIQIVRGEWRVTKGKVPAEFLDSLREACREFNVHTGWVGGVRRGKAIALRFSHHFPPPCQQRLRNAWFNP
jgi:hypothetical protein